MLSTWLKNEDMKSSCQKEESDKSDKKGYVFFSDPDVIVKRAETIAIEAQIRRDLEAQQQVFEKQLTNSSAPISGIKSLENLLSYHPVQPYPFTFISAVKQKLTSGSPLNNNIETHYLNLQARNNLISPVLKTNLKQNPYQVIQKMDFFKPLKVPDLKISPKTLDFSSRENSISKELPLTKSEIAVQESSHDRSDKTSKVGEKVQRKLDFSSDGPSTVNCESIEPLKAPNVSIASNLSKKKEHTHIRDSSREKENRSKRIKKDDSLCTKKDESAQEQVKRSRSPRHMSRKEMADSSFITTRLKNDRLSFHTAKNNDSMSTKSKIKTFVTSTAKKDNEKRQRSFNAQSIESAKDIPLESKGRTCSNKVPDSVSSKITDKVTMRDSSGMTVLSSNTENKPKDICHLRQIEDLKYKCDSDNRQLKQDKPNIIHKEQMKRISEKGKTLSNKIEGKIHNITSEPSDDIECTSETNSSKNRTSVYPVSSVQQSKNEDTETTMESKQNINSIRSAKISESLKYTEHSLTQSTSTTTKKDEESYSHSITTTGQMTTNDDTNNVDVGILPEELFDPRRISFRDNSYSQQEEFRNLTTPDKLDFIPRHKQRRYLIQSSDSEADARCPKYKSTTKSEKEQEKTPLRHPEALRMTLQAECEFFESLNEAYKNTKEVEKYFHNMKREQEEQNPEIKSEKGEEIRVEESRVTATIDNDFAENAVWKPLDYARKDVANTRKSHTCDDMHFIREHYALNKANVDETSDNFKAKVIKVAEVQTQTVNDMATQTDVYVDKRNAQNKLSDIHMYERSSLGENECPHLSLDSVEQFEDLDQIEGISVPSRITMSEISLHETTSSIKTETGNEISISTRDLTCLVKNKEFKKYLQLHLAQLIRDEKQRYDRLEMLFKDHEKNLNDRTKKLVRLEEQKRALRDTGQDSRISSVKKKQRALLLKLKEEKDEMNRLKELHEIASQERKLMLQKQRDMFNPQLSTKNILTKLKRSADSQSPRRSSGPMKGYDIRSNSSISSLIDSDKSQHDRSQADARLHVSESDIHLSKPDLAKSDKCENLAEETNTSATRFDDLAESNESHEENSLKKKNDMSKYESKSRKYEEKMPKADILRQKQSQLDLESKRIQSHSIGMKRLLENQKPFEISSSSILGLDAAVTDHVKSESDTLVEELSKKSKISQIADPFVQIATISKEKELAVNIATANSESIEEELNSKIQDNVSKATKSSQVSEDILQTNNAKNSKKIDKSISDRDHVSKKLQHSIELKTSSKRKSSKHQKTKSSSNILMENLLRSKASSHISEKFVKHHDKRTRIESELPQLDNNNESLVLDQLDLNESQNSLQELVRHSKEVKDKNLKLLSEAIDDYESKENVSSVCQESNRKFENNEHSFRNEQTVQNISTSQFSALTISRHSSEESEKNLSVVLRPEDRNFKAKKFGQILTARETALASRKNTVEDWMAWHTRLRAEEERVNRMEQAALKIVAATSNVLSQQDTTVSSDMSDVEGRIEILTEKLAERRVEMSRLKKEARKQAKQRLRAMEANLLNQIKKYDTTIHEMRKKLESKKAIKDNDKLAIEPKSLADFKVPEIPLKRIQDLYKNSDLLRSRSESDLLPTKNQQRDLLKIVTAAIYDDRHERNSCQKSTRSADIKSANASELKSTTDTNRSAQSMFEECTSTEVSSKPRTATSASSNDTRSERYIVPALHTDEKQLEESITIETKQNSISHDAENIQTIISTVRSELGMQTISDARSSKDHSTINTESVNNKPVSRTSIDRSQSKTLASQSEILEEMSNVNYSKSIPSKSDYSTESAAGSNRDILTFSKKLDSLQLNNKNLNENISCLENGLKVLSEMMSRFSNKTDKEFKTNNDERSTSHDISEIVSKSAFSDKVTHIEDEEKEAVSSEEEVNTESPSILTSERRSKSSNDLSHDKYISERADNDISTVISGVTPNLAHEIDYEAKSKEIMNEIEKSILSEHNKVVRGDYNVSSILENDMQNLRKDNEELLNDLISLELDVKSISEILSKVSESKKSLNLATNTATRIIDSSKEDTSAQSDLNKVNIEEDIVTDQANVTHSPKLPERSSAISTYSPIVAGHRTKESHEKNSQRTHSACTNQTSQIVASEDSKSSEKILELLGTETNTVNDIEISSNLQCVQDIQTLIPDNTASSMMTVSNVEQDRSRTISAGNISQDKDDWTTSDSFEVPQSEISTRVIEEEKEDSESENLRSHSDRMDDISNSFTKGKNVSSVEAAVNQNIKVSSANYVDVSTLIPKEESTNNKINDILLANMIMVPYVMKSDDELNDILDIIARENNQKKSIPDNECEKFDNVISDSVTDFIDNIENIVDDNGKSVNNFKKMSCNNKIDVSPNKRFEAISTFNDDTQNKINIKDINESNIVSANKSKDDKSVNREEVIDTSSQAVNETVDESAINIKLHVEIDDEESPREAISDGQEIIITELDSDSIDDHVLPELEIDAKVELAEDEETVSTSHTNEKQSRSIVPVEIQECLDPISEQDSSDGEQLDNLVEVAESVLDTVEKLVVPLQASAETATDDEKVSIRAQGETTNNTTNVNTSSKKKSDESVTPNEPIADNINKTFDILKDPDYEDISEESLEVSEILDKNELSKTSIVKKISLPEKYQVMQKSDEVLRILDEISQKSSPDSINNSPKDEKETQSATEEISELLGAEVSAEDNISSSELAKMKDKIGEEFYTDESKNRFKEEAVLQKQQPAETSNETGLTEEKSSGVSSRLDEGLQDDKSSQIIYELRERVSRLQEQDGSSESSEAGDTPRGVSEIEMDSPRDFNDSRLDIDILDDDLLSGTKATNQNADMKSNFHSASIVATSEKDIEAMIYKLKASLEQPGLEVAELEAKLLRIEQLEIELEIKKLEAEEVSYYVREIPNKPPPPYTPPEDGRLSTSLGSSSLLTAVIPSNVEELTSFTEKATALIYNAKVAGEDVASLEAPPEIYELTKEKNEVIKKDRRIYNTFLFDLCKETVAEIYRAEYEKPGPSWTKPNVKTKPTMKIPKTVEELTEYVGKEVATLFGFKTKLQRENMVMRWSRKRRDRVDELLAREAQAEEDEWTKFHHDELAVKNGLTVAILDTLVMETANVMKLAYGKKRRLMV